jgi:membrane protein
MNKKMPKKYYLLSFGIGFWLTGLFLLSNLWHTLRDNKAVPKVVKILVKFIEQSSGVPILLFFVGSILVFIFLYLSIEKDIVYYSYTGLSFLSFLAILLFWLVQQEIKWYLIICFLVVLSWLSHTILLLLWKIYDWIVCEKEKMLPKLTFTWTILAALFGYIFGKK